MCGWVCILCKHVWVVCLHLLGVCIITSKCMHYCERAARHGMSAHVYIAHIAKLLFAYLELRRTLRYGDIHRDKHEDIYTYI